MVPKNLSAPDSAKPAILRFELPPGLRVSVELPLLRNTARELLTGLDERGRHILEARFGLTTGEPRTLQAIGNEEKLTRERIRQLERAALIALRTTWKAAPGDAQRVRQGITAVLEAAGGAVREELLLPALGAATPKDQAMVRLLLSCTEGVTQAEETQRSFGHWALLKSASALPSLEQVLDAADRVLTRARHVLGRSQFFAGIRRELGRELADAALTSLLSISTRMGPTVFGEWGLRAWPEVTPRGMGDRAYSILKHSGKPFHFSAITERISAAGFDEKPAHPQTVHNELIRDARFVLVGRGLYGLRDWGYEPGTVAEVAARLLSRAGRPLTRAELVAAVLEKRLVKRNTVLLALQNRSLFRLLPDGRYALAAPPASTPTGPSASFSSPEPPPDGGGPGV